jgi:type VI secretion system protein ImpG
MDRAFLSYYEAELTHIRELSQEFAALHPNVARGLTLDAVPCPDPYVERLLEGVAYLAARTRFKVDAESTRYVRAVLDALYPDLVGPAPAMSVAVLHPGPQVQTMPDGHVVAKGARMIAAFREGISTRATYTTAQDVTLWPITLDAVTYLPDRGALRAAGLGEGVAGAAEAGLRITLRRVGAGSLSELSLDRLDVHFGGAAKAGAIFDAVFGWPAGVAARMADTTGPWVKAAPPAMVGIADDEALLPRTRPSFEGYRLLREYFLMPERFHYVRVGGLAPAIRACTGPKLDVVILFTRPCPEIADAALKDFRLFVTPVVNLFEKECNVVEVTGRTSAHPVYADRARPRDFEIYRLTKVEDAEAEGPEAEIGELYSGGMVGGAHLVYTTERRPRRPSEDEVRRGQTRTSYLGDEVFVSVARPAGAPPGRALRRLDIRALCTNRDLPILDDNPRLAMETGDPVARIELLGTFRRPRPSLPAALPRMAQGGEAELDDVAWRMVAQFSLNHLSLAEENQTAEPLRALLDLYAERGDPAHARHSRSLTRVTSRPVVERLGLPGPMCFGKGVEITLHVDEAPLAGFSSLLPSALLSHLFARYAGINSFVRTRTRLNQRQEEVAWPMSPGIRAPI